ncbi:DNA-binding protein [Rhodococcus qingshengii]|uniref:DNA-binding protein n=1 Tax=Actinomycetes TaxID=1760 RepID=UPI001423D925|nr:DNA-binding protein [Rhodococcus sp. FH8]MBW0282259.1 hypothetical protein [Rhodococcus sp. FH8]NHP18471.1 DNA-binding protein [Rhodococcus sp. IC4_135]
MTQQAYVVVAELDMQFDENVSGELLPPIIDHHGAVQRSELGWVEVVFTIPAVSVRQATTAALEILDTYTLGLLSLRVLTAADFDRIADAIETPRLLSTVHAAKVLGIYRPPG